MNIIVAQHYGMCFGVRDALAATRSLSQRGPATILGELVHNPVVTRQLDRLGVRHGHLRDLNSAQTSQVVITAHGAAERDVTAWERAGFHVTDTTCPLVRKAHTALARLVNEGYHPVVIGKRDHVEVLGLTGDWPQADVILDEADVSNLTPRRRLGVISQTTQPATRVSFLLERLRETFPESEIRYVDTVCQPTKDRQGALGELCRQVEVVIAVGGATSNNTRQLVLTAQGFGIRAYRVSGPSELRSEWFEGVDKVGVTAGTSTLEETVREVVEALENLRVTS